MQTYEEMSAAFEYQGTNKQAALLIHGFLASPYIMRSMGHVLSQAGYHVQSICLPGHGTNFNDLRTIKFEAWQHTVEEALIKLKATHEKVIIVGFSLGAILGLIAAFKHNVKQLVLLCPAFQISKGATLINALTTLHLGFLLPDLFCTQSEKINYGSYQQFPAFSVMQVYRAIQHYNECVKTQTTLPEIYVAGSTEDGTVEFAGIEKAMRRYPSTSHFRIYTNQKDLKSLPANSYKIIRAQNFAKVQAFSHVSIPVTPTDSYFGENGQYYSHLPKSIVFGEPTWKDKGKPIKRLTYNPDFNQMVYEILGWLIT